MAEFIQRRRHLNHEMECRSESMYHYLGKNGGRLFGAMQRIAMLYIATEDNAENRGVVESITATQFEILSGNLKDFQNQVEALKRTARRNHKGELKLPKLEIPENHKHDIAITHPIFNKLVDNLRYFDNGMATLEVLWLMGLLDEDRYKFARMKMASTYTYFSNEVFRITNRLRETDTGRGSTSRRVGQQIAAQIHQAEAAVDESPALEHEGELSAADVQAIIENPVSEAEEMKEKA